MKEVRQSSRKPSIHYVMPRDIEAPFNPCEEVHVRDGRLLRAKIEQMREDGREKLGVFADFDCTLTRKTIGELRADNSFKVIENVRYPLRRSRRWCVLSSSKDALQDVRNTAP